MKQAFPGMAILVSLMLLCGCASTTKRTRIYDAMMPPSSAGNSMTEVRIDRMMIWKAALSIEVWNMSNAVAEAVAMTESYKGFVEHKSDRGEKSARLTLRIPVKAFNLAVGNFESLGTVIYRTVQGEDITEQYIDIKARVKNKIVLRDRLTKLLDKAKDVKDILSIERELNRVQSDIDSMQGRIKSLKGQVEYATVTLSLSRKVILGPLGYFFKVLFWGIEKLFVIRH